MLATIEIIDLLDDTDDLSEMIINSETFNDYVLKKKAYLEDIETQQLIRQFAKLKDDYQDVERFGRYHPDYSKILKETRLMKREIDMKATVSAFKVAERKLQALLDQVAEKLAYRVSKDIIVERDGGLFKEHSGGCGSGGSCGCSA